MSRKTIKELLPDLITFVLAFNIFAAMHLFVYEQLPWIFLLALLPFFVLYLSRRFMINLLIFLILHLAYIGLPMLIFSGALRWNLFGFTLITGAYSIYIHSRDDTTMFKHIDKYTVAIFGIIAFIYGWLDFGTPAAMSFLIISTITTFCMIIACRSMANVDFSLMVMHDRYKKQPTNDVVATNNAMIAVFLIGIIVLAVLSAVLPMGAIASGVLGFIWSIFGLIIYGFVRIIAIFLPYIREMDAPEHEGAPIVVDTQPPFDYEYLLDLDIAWGLFGRIAGIIAGIFVLYLLVLLMFRISQRRRVTEDKIESLLPETTTERIKFMLNSVTSLFPKIRRAPKHPIRRAFYKKVNGYIKEGLPILKSYTPDTIADKIRPYEDIAELTDKYEQVRYREDS